MQLLRSSAKILLCVIFVFGFAACASAQVTWTFNNVTFSGGYTVTGSFTTNSTATTITSFDISVSGPDAFTAPPGSTSSAYLSNTPPEIGIFAPSPSFAYVDLFPATSLTGAGGTISLTSGLDCPGSAGCYSLTSTDAEIVGVTPEPATGGLMLLGVGLLMSAWFLRRGLRPIQ